MVDTSDLEAVQQECIRLLKHNETLTADANRLRLALAQSDADSAWAAGLFEGEGCVSWTGTGVRITVQMVDADIVARWGAVVGSGRLLGPYQPTVAGRKPYYQWTICKSDDVEAALIRFRPWLGQRRLEQFEAAFARKAGRKKAPEAE